MCPKLKLGRSFQLFSICHYQLQRERENIGYRERTRRSMETVQSLRIQRSLSIPGCCLLGRTWLGLLRRMLAFLAFPYLLRFHDPVQSQREKCANLDLGKVVRNQTGEVISNLTEKGDAQTIEPQPIF